MDIVHVVRHKVLVEGRTQRAVARELGFPCRTTATLIAIRTGGWQALTSTTAC